MATLLSEHFSLEELTTSQHRQFDNTPNAQQLSNLKNRLAPKLEQVRALVGPMHVNSAFRCTLLNSAVGGASNSMHVDGLACDFIPINHTLRDAFKLILDSGLGYDQMISEFFTNGGLQGSGGWIHIAAAPDGRTERHSTIMIGGMTGGKYLPWDPSKIA